MNRNPAAVQASAVECSWRRPNGCGHPPGSAPEDFPPPERSGRQSNTKELRHKAHRRRIPADGRRPLVLEDAYWGRPEGSCSSCELVGAQGRPRRLRPMPRPPPRPRGPRRRAPRSSHAPPGCPRHRSRLGVTPGGCRVSTGSVAPDPVEVGPAPANWPGAGVAGSLHRHLGHHTSDGSLTVDRLRGRRPDRVTAP